MSTPEFEYRVSTVGKLGVEVVDVPGSKKGEKAIQSILVDGEPIKPTGRFWESIYATFGINKGFFKYFTYAEVFQRLAERTSQSVRLCVEKRGEDKSLLAVTSLNKPVILYEDLVQALDGRNMVGELSYCNGIVSSTHVPTRGSNEFSIGGDKFQNRFVMQAPVDGYGQPNIFLSLLRYVCTNGAVGFANSFKTALGLGQGGDSIQYTLRRALDAFSNEEGYALLRDRFQAAMRSWASIREQQSLYKLVLDLQGDKTLRGNVDKLNFNPDDLQVGFGSALMRSFARATSDPFQTYGITDHNLLTPKKQRTLPVGCKVYDMINYASEMATHFVSPENARRLQVWIGDILSGDYDLEDSCDQFTDFQDLFVAKKA